MKRKLVATTAVLLLILPALTCSLSRSAPVTKWHLTLEIDPSVPNREKLVDETVAVLRNRLDRFGLASSRYEVLGDPAKRRIRANLPDVEDLERIKNVISSQGSLELVHIVSDPSQAPFQTYSAKTQAQASLAADQTVLPFSERFESHQTSENPERWVIARVPPIVSRRDLRSAQAVRSYDNVYNVAFTLKAPAAAKFGIWTAANINQYLGVVLNGRVYSIAYIKSQIFDSGEIEGGFTKQSAEDLAKMLLGPLPTPVKIVEEGAN